MINKKASSLECPSCHQIDRVQKVSAIQRTDSIINLKGQNLLGSYNLNASELSGGIGAFAASGNQTTALSKQLALPGMEPEPKSNMSIWIFFISGIVAFFAFLGLFSSESFLGSFIVFSISIVIAVFSFKGYIKETDRYGDYLSRWQRKRQLVVDKWNHLYYCYRCDGVFIPGMKLAPAEKIVDYLYSSDPIDTLLS